MGEPLDYATPQTPNGGRTSDALFVIDRVALPACPRLVRSRARVRLTDGRDVTSQLGSIGGVAVLLGVFIMILAIAGRIGSCGIAGLSVLSTFALMLMIPATAATLRRREGDAMHLLSFERADDQIDLPFSRRRLSRSDVRRVECVSVGGWADFESEIELVVIDGIGGVERRVGVVRVGYALRSVAAALAGAMDLPFRDVIYRGLDAAPTVSEVDAAGRPRLRSSTETSV